LPRSANTLWIIYKDGGRKSISASFPAPMGYSPDIENMVLSEDEITLTFTAYYWPGEVYDYQVDLPSAKVTEVNNESF